MINGLNINKEDIKKGIVITIDKPYKWTSFDLVKKVRYSLENKFRIKKIKVGHAGTLDPLATGLMIICIGKSTKLIETFQGLEKEYIATIKLGATTPSFDKETSEDKTFDISHITEDLLKQAVKKQTGIIYQTPPIYSAKRVNGTRAYSKARKGESFDLKPVKIEIKNIKIIKFNPSEVILNIICSKGTYIRALARDIGILLDSGAYLVKLQRTRIGEYNIKNALSIEEFINNLKIS
ncbi:MAG: tRNA pseudouridine(55) synthase TruB [Bacteroidales bacterium]|nr:tRNA pseudouridine(55) synthase TruB [Bacteroidales bacterium]